MSRKDRINNPEPAVCLIAFNTTLSKSNELGLVREELSTLGLHNIKQVNGRWAGEDELAYVVELPVGRDPFMMQKLTAIAKAYGQEEIWILLEPETNGKRRVFRLREPEWKHAEQLGYFVPCTQSKAYTQAGWTFDANTGQHYILEQIGE